MTRGSVFILPCMVVCDGVINDCDESVLPTDETDQDQDGYGELHHRSQQAGAVMSPSLVGMTATIKGAVEPRETPGTRTLTQMASASSWAIRTDSSKRQLSRRGLDARR